MLDRREYGTTPLSPEPETLYEPHREEQDRCPDADSRVDWQEPYGESRDSHGHECYHQHRLAPDLVAVMTSDQGADRTDHESSRERSESRQGPYQGIEGGEEQLVKRQSGERPINEVIVPLKGGAYKGRHGHTPDRGVRGNVFSTDSFHNLSFPLFSFSFSPTADC
jgi:hypothetical protein